MEWRARCLPIRNCCCPASLWLVLLLLLLLLLLQVPIPILLQQNLSSKFGQTGTQATHREPCY
jgi:hypothetical protein